MGSIFPESAGSDDAGAGLDRASSGAPPPGTGAGATRSEKNGSAGPGAAERGDSAAADAEATADVDGPPFEPTADSGDGTPQDGDPEIRAPDEPDPETIDESDSHHYRKARNRPLLSGHEEVFVHRVLAAMNGDLEGYDFPESMSRIDDSVPEADPAAIVENGHLKKHTICRRTFYTVTEKGRAYIDKTLSTGPGEGDIGEETPHKVGVALFELWLEQQPRIDGTATYHEHDKSVYDVVGVAGGERTVIAEVETPSNNHESVLDDYEKLGADDAKAVWVVPNRRTLLDLVFPILENRGKLHEAPSGRDANSMCNLREWVTERSLPGMATVYTFREVFSEVDK
jgi:hypothetical protein